MSQTEHYNLKQWEGWEVPRRDHLNAALAAVDTALDDLADSKADQTSTNSRLNSLSARLEVRLGTYTGNGADSQSISLGFSPQAVLVEGPYGARSGGGGLVMPGKIVGGTTGQTRVILELNGSTLIAYQGDGAYTNISGYIYRYLAVK